MGFSTISATTIVLVALLAVLTTALSGTVRLMTELAVGARDSLVPYVKSVATIVTVSNVTYNITVGDGTANLSLTLYISNNGTVAFWDMEGCDLLLVYHDASGAKRVLVLRYSEEGALSYSDNAWRAAGVMINGGYTYPWSSRRIVYPSETLVVEAKAELASPDLSSPFSVVFTTHTGGVARASFTPG